MNGRRNKLFRHSGGGNATNVALSVSSVPLCVSIAFVLPFVSLAPTEAPFPTVAGPQIQSPPLGGLVISEKRCRNLRASRVESLAIATAEKLLRQPVLRAGLRQWRLAIRDRHWSLERLK